MTGVGSLGLDEREWASTVSKSSPPCCKLIGPGKFVVDPTRSADDAGKPTDTGWAGVVERGKGLGAWLPQDGRVVFATTGG